MSLDEQVELDLLRRQQRQNAVNGKQSGESVAADVLECVRSLPEDQALLLFHRLRASYSSNDTVSLDNVSKEGKQKQEQDIDRTPKAILTAHDILPASRHSVEYELMLRHPVLYPRVSPETQPILVVASAAKLSSRGERVPVVVEDLNSLL